MSDFRIPETTHRTAVIGRTGSGKTQSGLWWLSFAPFDQIPYIIIDFKRDELIGSIPYLQDITYNELPHEPGLYRLKTSDEELEELDMFFRNVLEQEHTGLFIDETYPIGKNSKPFNMLLNQGRSKHIQMFCLTQRPSWISRYVFSESDFFNVFHLNMRDDEKTVESMTPLNLNEPLPEFYSRWHDVSKNKNFRLMPVPKSDMILSRYKEKLSKLHEHKVAEQRAKRTFI